MRKLPVTHDVLRQVDWIKMRTRCLVKFSREIWVPPQSQFCNCTNDLFIFNQIVSKISKYCFKSVLKKLPLKKVLLHFARAVNTLITDMITNFRRADSDTRYSNKINTSCENIFIFNFIKVAYKLRADIIPTQHY